jgi:DNA-binding transcriptional ArsR family regulator
MLICSEMADKQVPDYQLDESMELTSPAQVRAISHPLRTTILGLLHERAASVSEVAIAVGRPKSTVAYHMALLEQSSLVRVIRTRRVRAIEERYFGRTARMFYVGVGHRGSRDAMPLDFNDFEVAGRESQEAYERRRLRSFIRHARLSPERATEFWARAIDLVHEFDRLPRSGKTAYGFAVGLYPIRDYPVLPDAEE